MSKAELLEFIIKDITENSPKLTEQNLITIYNCMDTIKENEANFSEHIESVFKSRHLKLVIKHGKKSN